MIISILTILTQIGGVLWILVFCFFKIKKKETSSAFKILAFILIYLFFTLFIIPPTAKYFGRTALPMDKSTYLIPHNYITPLLNRHYVTFDLKNELITVSNHIHSRYPGIKVSYLDANFPFIDGFPLLPHRSHDDGRKVDLSFHYTKDGNKSNLKPSTSGYGYYEGPLKNEWNQNKKCKANGYWQYDFPKYLTLGSVDELIFDKNLTKEVIEELLRQPKLHKIFIEPHLKHRLGLTNDRVRFHGCAAVRHDDHIHYQILK